MSVLVLYKSPDPTDPTDYTDHTNHTDHIFHTDPADCGCKDINTLAVPVFMINFFLTD